MLLFHIIVEEFKYDNQGGSSISTLKLADFGVNNQIQNSSSHCFSLLWRICFQLIYPFIVLTSGKWCSIHESSFLPLLLTFSVNLSPAILVDMVNSPWILLTIPGETKTPLLLSWFWPDFHQDLLESPSTDILASFHGWRGHVGLGISSQDLESPCIHTAKCEKSLLCLDFPLGSIWIVIGVF